MLPDMSFLTGVNATEPKTSRKLISSICSKGAGVGATKESCQ